MNRFCCIAANPEGEVFATEFVLAESDEDVVIEEINDSLLTKVGYSGGIWGVLSEENIVVGLLGFYKFYCLKKLESKARFCNEGI